MPIRAGSVFRRGTPPVEIITRNFRYEPEGNFKTVMLSLPAHTATHIDVGSSERSMSPERMIGKGKLIDVTNIKSETIQLSDIENQVQIQAGDFVLFRTDWSKFAGTEKYYQHPELSWELIEFLISNRINAVGIDALGLGRERLHGEYDKLLTENDIFVIENLAKLSTIPEKEFGVYCFPLSIEHVDAFPARVLVEIDLN